MWTPMNSFPLGELLLPLLTYTASFISVTVTKYSILYRGTFNFLPPPRPAISIRFRGSHTFLLPASLPPISDTSAIVPPHSVAFHVSHTCQGSQTPNPLRLQVIHV